MPQQHMTDAAHITIALETLGMNHTELADILRLGHSTVSGWIRKNTAPTWTVFAVKGVLMDRAPVVDDGGDRLVVVQCNGAESTAVKAVAVALGAHVTEFGLLERRAAT